MTFKKGDIKTKLAGSKGGLKAQQTNHDEIFKNLADGRSNGINMKRMNANIEHQREAGRQSRKAEEIALLTIKNDYDTMYKPYCICDAVCIKDGKVIFVEVKRIRNGVKEELRPLQKEFKELCDKLNIRYHVIYIDYNNNGTFHVQNIPLP